MSEDGRDLPVERRPVPVSRADAPLRRPDAPDPSPPRRKATQAEKVTRRLSGLTPGVYELLVTVDAQGIVSWVVRYVGKVEQ